MEECENKDVRKAAMAILDLNEHTFPSFLLRTRDIDPDIRSSVYRKLLIEKVPLSNLSLCNIYKIIFDGIGSREHKVKDQCLDYIKWNIFGKRVK